MLSRQGRDFNTKIVWQTAWSACLDNQVTFGKKSGGIFIKVRAVIATRCMDIRSLSSRKAFANALSMCNVLNSEYNTLLIIVVDS